MNPQYTILEGWVETFDEHYPEKMTTHDSNELGVNVEKINFNNNDDNNDIYTGWEMHWYLRYV